MASVNLLQYCFTQTCSEAHVPLKIVVASRQSQIFNYKVQ